MLLCHSRCMLSNDVWVAEHSGSHDRYLAGCCVVMQTVILNIYKLASLSLKGLKVSSFAGTHCLKISSAPACRPAGGQGQYAVQDLTDRFLGEPAITDCMVPVVWRGSGKTWSHFVEAVIGLLPRTCSAEVVCWVSQMVRLAGACQPCSLIKLTSKLCSLATSPDYGHLSTTPFRTRPKREQSCRCTVSWVQLSAGSCCLHWSWLMRCTTRRRSQA